jgi:hypothetical protein
MPDITAVRDAAIQEFLSTELANTFSPLSASTKPRLNVTAISIATKIRNGEDTGQECIRFYVERKVPPGPIPHSSLLPKEYHGVPTDVIESGRFVAFPTTGPYPGRFRPIHPGISCGFRYPAPDQAQLMGGTLGALVALSGQTYILSNNHVLANCNLLPLGSPIFQPALLDGGAPATDRVATLSHFIPLNPTAPNLVDCAIALVDSGISVSPVFPPNVGKLASANPIEAVKTNPVEKIGWRTGYSDGTVFDTGVAVTVQYSFGAAILTNQILFQGTGGDVFAAGGDSGSVVVDQQSKRGVAQIVAGSEQYTAGTPLATVLDLLGVTLMV